MKKVTSEYQQQNTYLDWMNSAMYISQASTACISCTNGTILKCCAHHKTSVSVDFQVPTVYLYPPSHAVFPPDFNAMQTCTHTCWLSTDTVNTHVDSQQILQLKNLLRLKMTGSTWTVTPPANSPKVSWAVICVCQSNKWSYHFMFTISPRFFLGPFLQQ